MSVLKLRYRKKSSGGIPHAERLLRIDCHKVHTVALIANAAVRNRWINDELLQVHKTPLSLQEPDFALQARLLSLTPSPIQNSFSMIHKSRIPDDVKRGYLFEQAVSRLASWWADTFFTVRPTGHLRNRTFDDVQRVLLSKGLVDVTGKGKAKALPHDVDPLDDLFEDDQVEIVRSAKSLMKHALMRSGSRDVSSQLFTALCRALGVPARLVVSLQSVPWQTNVGLSKTPAKKRASNAKGKAVALREAEDSSEDMEVVVVSPQNEYSSGDNLQAGGDATGKSSSAWPNGKGKPSHTVTLQKTKSSGQKLSFSNSPSARSRSRESFVDLTVTTMYTQRARIRLRLHLSFGQRFSRVLIAAGSPLTLYVPSSTSARFSTRLQLAPRHVQHL
jgi:xeroderma pigmentosum group C-complementing protein